MSRYSLNSSLALFQSVLTDPDATSSSTSSNSAINNSSNSLCVSPSIEREIKLTKQSHQTINNHYKEQLQKEIKEEGEEIFANINSLINNCSDLYSSLDETDFEDNIVGSHVDLNLNFHLADKSQHYLSTEPDKEYIEHTDTEVFEDELNVAVRQQDDHRNQYVITGHHAYVTCNQDEDDQHDDHQYEMHQHLTENQEHENFQVLQKDLQQLTSNLPKPCVFFLEGNCRRSDCKYSHDLSKITCKYWIEGFCFKGDMCPFLHSFNLKVSDDSSLMDGTEDDLSLSKKNLNPTFVIESEADFPSLPLDSPNATPGDKAEQSINTSSLTKTIKNQILTSNPAVVFKTTKKKRKR